jgi:FlaA1/EpsC-like NDP-sugar epimerase
MKPRRTLIVGTGEEAQLVHRKISSHPEYALEVVGFLDNRDVDGAGPVVGDPDEIAGLIDEAGLQAAWDDWAAQGGDMITAEYNEAYHAAQK